MITVGPGMASRMAQAGDHPIYGHEQGQNEDGSQYEKCWGTKGLYLSSSASAQLENVGPFWAPRSLDSIRTRQGQDIRDLVLEASAAARIPAALLLGCLMAESNMDARAERWGSDVLTAQAKAALATNDSAALRNLIPKAGSDISFGLAQRIVKFHYVGTREMTLENILHVREYVFSHVEQDVREAAASLSDKLKQARAGDLSPVGGDELLGACAAYNCGRFPSPEETYWTQRAAEVARYRDKLKIARTILGGA
jgi:hypothetical protein